jgi:transposase
MFIRRTTTRRAASGETYHTHRLVESRRIDGKVRQATLLNLGRHFPVPEDQWPALCARVQQLLDQSTAQQAILIPVELAEVVETEAQRLFSYLITQSDAPTPAPEYAEVDVHSLELVQPRSVGVEHVGLHALETLGMAPLLASLGIPAVTRALIQAQIIARMAAPASELATWGWLNAKSALGELLGLSFTDVSIMRLYRSADVLMRHKDAIEEGVYGRLQELFSLETTVTLYDLTNTYFEGEVAGNAKAQRGHSKEKRSDCPLLTLGLVLDGNGFVRRSRTFAGNAVEYRTLEAMLTGLDAPKGALVVMDRGIATEANLAWLRQEGYRYLVVSRERGRVMPEGDVTVVTAGGDTLQVEKTLNEAGDEVRLTCHSPRREAKETGINERFRTRFEKGLTRLAENLAKPRGEKRPAVIEERIGRLKQGAFGVGQHYTLTLETNEEKTRVTNLTWAFTPKAGSMMTDPGVYCLRSTETNWSEEELWRTYMMLTDLEAVFRSLKSELGMRPVYHHKEERADGHLFISVLAYQCVQLIRRNLKEHDIHLCWAGLRTHLSGQHRVTVCFTLKDGRSLQIRKATQPEGIQKRIYEILGIDPLPGGTKKHVV